MSPPLASRRRSTRWSRTADLVGIITQHFFETLFTFDKNWKVTPLLAETMPDISADGKTYTIKLRQGVTLP